MPRSRRHGAGRHSGTTDSVVLPAAFVAAAQRWLGDAAPSFLARCAEPPRLCAKANVARGGVERLTYTIGPAAQAWPRVPWWPQALSPPPDQSAYIAGHLAARVGALYAQDPTALAAVAALDPRPGDRVLDLCAAPGGKSTAIVDRLGGRGLLVGNDVEVRRARDLERALARWGAANSAVLSLRAERLAELAPGYFDRVLVDAPCSGEAMFGRHARASADWSWAHVSGCAARQRALLAAARGLVRSGGVLVYATCTFNPIENEAVIAHYLASHRDDTLEDVRSWLPDAAPGRADLLPPAQTGASPDALVYSHQRSAEVTLARCARLWPHEVDGAGHFVARIRVGASPPVRAVVPDRPAGDDREVDAVWRAVGNAAPGLTLDGRITIRGDRAYLVHDDLPWALQQAALAPGLRLAERRGSTWRPAHALAMAIAPEQAAQVAHLDDDEAVRFLDGEGVSRSGSGLCLATWLGYPLGWARLRGGSLTPLWPAAGR